MRVDGGIRVRPIPSQHLDSVSPHGADLDDAPVIDDARLAAAGGFLDPVLFQGHDQSTVRWQKVDRGRHRKIRIEQHRAAMRCQRLDQEALGRRDVGVGYLIPGYLLGLRDRLEHRRPLIERHHAKIAVRIS